jgi:hypothetical protein
MAIPADGMGRTKWNEARPPNPVVSAAVLLVDDDGVLLLVARVDEVSEQPAKVTADTRAQASHRTES